MCPLVIGLFLFHLSFLCLMVLSHWPWAHVAEQVPQQVAELVAELVEQHLASVKAL